MEQYLCPHCDKMFSVQRNPSDSIISCPHCRGTVFLENSELPPGSVLGGFEIIKVLGKGGMGNVYLAKQSSMQRLVALKVLLKAMVGDSDKNIIEMFGKEIQLSGKLNHPNIIKAIDAGEESNCFFMAITYVDGEDFEKIIDRGEPVPEKEAFTVALSIADALSYAWEKHGLLHKDIKPGNIMRDKKGQIFLMDMGIAQLNFGRSTAREKEVLGSPFYMSPEQAQGLPLDWQTDMYSLGATLYHMILGVPPYDSKDVRRIIEKHITDPFPEPRERNPNLHLNPSTVSILKRMMEKKPEKRFGSWDELQKTVKRAFFNTAKVKEKGRPLNAINRKEVDLKKTDTRKSAVNVPPPKEKLSESMIVINSALFIVVALIIGYFINGHMKDKKAETSIQKADRYFSKNPSNFQEAFRLYSIAIQDAKGTKYFVTASQRLEAARARSVAFAERARVFDETYKKANELYAKRRFKDALDTILPVKDIEDPARKQSADSLIAQLQALIDAKVR